MNKPMELAKSDAVDTRLVPSREAGLTLPLQISERKLLLGAVDLVLLNGVLLGVAVWRLGLPLHWTSLVDHATWFLLFSAVWLVLGPLLDAYSLRQASEVGSAFPVGAAAAFAAAIVYLAVPYVTPMLHASRLTVAVFLLGSSIAVGAWRACYAVVFSQPTFRRRALIVGAGWAGQAILGAIRDHAGTEYDVVGFVDDDPAKQGTTVDGLSVLGNGGDLSDIIAYYRPEEIIVAITHIERMEGELFAAIMDAHERGGQITQMPALYEQLTGRVAVEHAGRNLAVILPPAAGPTRMYLAAKWAFDKLVGIMGLALTILLTPFVAVALFVEDRGPVFYRQARLGQGGRPFLVVKFRTMHNGAEANGVQWAQASDARVTRVGRILRRLHLDEVPQAINLLRGELSFIGPRPERPEFVKSLDTHIPFYRARHAVRPGITGWAQVNFGYGASVEDALIKLQYDLYYVKHQSAWLDLTILVRTLGLVLTLRGR